MNKQNQVQAHGPHLQYNRDESEMLSARRRLNVLVLTNWIDDGKWDLARRVSSAVNRFDILQPLSLPTHSKFASSVNRLLTKLSEFYIPVLAILRRAQYDVIVSWTSRLSVNYALLNRAFPFPGRPRHVAVDYHIDLRRKDLPYRLRLLLLRCATPGMDICFCTSTLEERIYADRFPGLASTFRFLPLDYPDYFKYPILTKENYVFAYGNSGRDFHTLIQAAKNLDVPILILSQVFKPDGELPSNVTIIRDLVSQEELLTLIRSARIVVVPLLHFDFSVGQLALTETMALGCALILTSNMATIEYAKHGESALFVDAGDADGLRTQIQLLVDFPDRAEKLGQEARRQALAYANRHADVFLETLTEVAGCLPRQSLGSQ